MAALLPGNARIQALKYLTMQSIISVIETKTEYGLVLSVRLNTIVLAYVASDASSGSK